MVAAAATVAATETAAAVGVIKKAGWGMTGVSLSVCDQREKTWGCGGWARAKTRGVLTRFFETQSHALHLEVGYALFQTCSSSSCLKLGPALLPTSWVKKNGVDSFLILPLATLPLFKEAGIDLNAVRSLSSSAASAASPSFMPSDFDTFFWRSFENDHLLVRFSGDNSTNRKELASLLVGQLAPWVTWGI